MVYWIMGGGGLDSSCLCGTPLLGFMRHTVARLFFQPRMDLSEQICGERSLRCCNYSNWYSQPAGFYHFLISGCEPGCSVLLIKGSKCRGPRPPIEGTVPKQCWLERMHPRVPTFKSVCAVGILFKWRWTHAICLRCFAPAVHLWGKLVCVQRRGKIGY